MDSKKILLVKPPSSTVYGYPKTPPLGVGLLASILKEANFTARAVDMRVKGYSRKKFLQELNNFRPDIVGFSASSFEYLNTVELCKAVKEFNRGIITIIGGPHASACPEKTIEAEEIDYLAMGEGDYLIRDFVEAFPDAEKIRRLEGIGYREGGKITLNGCTKAVSDLNRLPFVDMNLFNMDNYKAQGKITVPLFTSRGCPYQCSYCTSFNIHGRKYRTRSWQNLIDEIEFNMKRFSTRYFTILDDTFNVDRQRVLDFCSGILKRGLDIEWECVQGIRADRADEEVFYAMKRSGCKQVAIGIESADEAVLKAMNKGESLESIKNVVFAANKTGLITKGFFIVGAPYDTKEKVLKAVRFFKENKIYIPRFSMMVAYPKTSLEKWVRQNAKLFYEPYDYVTRHNELKDADVQFETGDFLRQDRIKMFRYADAQAEIWFIRNKLIDKFGTFFGKFLALFFYLRINRRILKLAYELNLINAYS